MLIIGEKLNSSIPSAAAAIEKRDKAFVQKLALEQVAAGADVIDVNAGTFLTQEVELLAWLVETVQEAVEVPLCIDSPNVLALQAALPLARQKPIVNSISAEEARYQSVIPLIKKAKAGVIALVMDDQGIPSTTEERMVIARRLVERLTQDGVQRDDIYLDVMVQPIGTESTSGKVALETVQCIHRELKGVHITCGLSNVSFGLPKRRLLNQAYAIALTANGMDALFIDPLDEKLMALIHSMNALMGSDEFCCDYLAAYREGKLG
ncbi:dihydropteroate synthase [Sporomusa termitida]|uniref:5-methyltetrahydrofolate:corrinoid/iron-sulfur protein co-methyltransferase n=1 Tax=Sporomusa termitida TaxID=2377 RepID=A0A517DW01_9FIRM|nr:dihydropteroate synthase [Sporomusa termitida]QDR81535.1 5-methyltetrahydrofolate:corrinoid/iron-sulfur protein co-methyltransferase [Sporomusa termitida]